MKMKSGLNLYNALTNFEVECGIETSFDYQTTFLATVNKSLADAEKQLQVERVEHRLESARVKGVVPTDPADLVSICDYPRWKEGEEWVMIPTGIYPFDCRATFFFISRLSSCARAMHRDEMKYYR